MVLLRFMHRKIKKRIFLDHASATPILPEVSSLMSEYNRKFFANPSALYKEALIAHADMERARKGIADILRAQPDEIVFTASGTEADNLAISGITDDLFGNKKHTPHIIVSRFEHSAILESVKKFERKGGKVTYVGVDEKGFVSPKDILAALTPETVLVSVMYVNNEIGTIQPIKEIAKTIRYYKKHHAKEIAHCFYGKGPLFHTDASAGANYLSLEVLTLGVDLMTLDAAKIYGPKGIGLLYAKRGIPLSPAIVGGGQEGGRRSGTENISHILGFAKALAVVQSDREKEGKRLTKLRDHAIQEISKRAPGSHQNGGGSILPNTINICFPGFDAQFLVLKLDVRGIAVSSSSACQSKKEDAKSHVLAVLGNKGCDTSSLRITLGRYTKKTDVDALVRMFPEVLK